jgi:hypothetical protein
MACGVPSEDEKLLIFEPCDSVSISHPTQGSNVISFHIMYRRLCVVTGLATAAACTTTPVVASAQHDLATACKMRLTAPRTLRLADGRWLRIEPSTVVPLGDTVLIVGHPSSLISLNAGGGESWEATDSLLGGILYPNGAVAPVYSPPVSTHAINDVRAAPLGHLGWLVTFAEVEPGGDLLPSGGRRLRIWAGIYDGKRWTGVSEMAVAGAGVALARMASPLVVHHDTIFFALPDSNVALRSAPAILRYAGHRWTRERVANTERFSFAEVALSFDASGAPLLGVVRADRSLKGDDNSIFLYRRDSAWRQVARIARGGYEPANGLRWLISGDVNWLTWWATIRDQRRLELRVRRVRSESVARDSVQTIDSSISRYTTASVPVGPAYIAALHDESGRVRLRVFEVAEKGVARVIDARTALSGTLAAAALPNGKLFIAGSATGTVGQPHAVTHVFTTAPCPSAAR